MKITTNITVEDYIYDFYSKVAQDMGNVSPEEIMSRALFMYAGIVAMDIEQKHGDFS